MMKRMIAGRQCPPQLLLRSLVTGHLGSSNNSATVRIHAKASSSRCCWKDDVFPNSIGWNDFQAKRYLCAAAKKKKSKKKRGGKHHHPRQQQQQRGPSLQAAPAGMNDVADAAQQQERDVSEMKSKTTSTTTTTVVSSSSSPNNLILPPPKRLLHADGTTLLLSDDFDETIMPPLVFRQDATALSERMPSAPTSWHGYEASTPLTDELVEQICLVGRPLSTAAFMRAALTHPEHGYYVQQKQHANTDDFDDDDYEEDAEPSTTNQLIGPAGDFVTAPELSQVFGECLGVWFYTQWQQQQGEGSLDWQWLECGPGTGRLMHDLMHFAWHLSENSSTKSSMSDGGRAHPHPFAANCRAIHLVEASPWLRDRQRQSLTDLQQQINSTNHQRLQFVFHDDDKNYKVESKGSNSSAADKDNDGLVTVNVYWHDSLGAFLQQQQQPPQQTDDAIDTAGTDSSHITNNSHLPLLPTFCVCQEFLDALPVYAFEKTTDGVWRERLVDVAVRDDMVMDVMNDNNSTATAGGSDTITDRKDDAADASSSLDNDGSPATSTGATSSLPDKKPRLCIVLAPEATPAVKTLLSTDEQGHAPAGTALAEAPVGSVVEVSPESILVAQDLADLIARQGGAALMVDYGQAGAGDSLRGFSRHEQVHFLSRPGLVDVTANVDFAALKHAVNTLNDNDDAALSATAFGPTTQGEFLMAMGLQERVIQLMERDDVTDEQANDLYMAMVRLASPEEMGERFKVLCITRQEINGAPPPGFAE